MLYYYDIVIHMQTCLRRYSALQTHLLTDQSEFLAHAWVHPVANCTWHGQLWGNWSSMIRIRVCQWVFSMAPAQPYVECACEPVCCEQCEGIRTWTSARSLCTVRRFTTGYCTRRPLASSHTYEALASSSESLRVLLAKQVGLCADELTSG